MSNFSRFPNSARAAWLLRQAQNRPVRISTEERERRLLARELARDLRKANLEKLAEVARLLGRTPKWIEMVRLEARRPGLLGKAILRAAK